MSTRAFALLLTLIASAHAGAAGEADHQPLETIREAVVDFVTRHHDAGEALDVSPLALDRRLRLARCAAPLETGWARGSARVGQVTLEVRCTGQRPWRLYVPARVSLHGDVVVAARPLARGQQLASADVTLERRDLGRVSGDPVRDPARVVGYRLTRPLAAGAVLTPGVLRAPQLVQRGQRVRLVAEGDGIYISMAGHALNAGALGDTVRVRNPASRRVVDAVVTGPGEVALAVTLPTARMSASH